jgi:hypothetical protein
MKANKPFEFIFKNFSPDEFCYIFDSEKYQTRAFILSYSPNDDYIREVIKLYADSKFSKVLTAYLSDKKNEAAYSDFTGEVSDYLESVMKNRDKFMELIAAKKALIDIKEKKSVRAL